MKIAVFLLLLFSAVVGVAQNAVEEIEFVHAPSFFDETSIVLSKLHDGSVVCTVWSRPEVADEHGRRVATKLKAISIASEVYAQLAAALEKPRLRVASENLERVLDGTNWIFTKRKGGFQVRYFFSSPSERRGGIFVVELGQQFAAAAVMSELLSPHEEPNQRVERNSGTASPLSSTPTPGVAHP